MTDDKPMSDDIPPKDFFSSRAFLRKYHYNRKTGHVTLTLLLKRIPNEKQRKRLSARISQEFTVIAWETNTEIMWETK